MTGLVLILCGVLNIVAMALLISIIVAFIVYFRERKRLREQQDTQETDGG